MNRITTRTLLLAFAVATTAAGTATAQDEKVGRACTLKTVKGDYALLISGTRPVPGSNPVQLEPIIGHVIASFDGEGGFAQLRNSKGATFGVETDVAVSGTYTLDADCTGEWQHPLPGLPTPGVARFVVSQSGEEIRFFATTPPPVMITGSGNRIWSRTRNGQ